jgi:hypothetical protein
MFCKNIIKKPYIFRSLSYDHSQGSSFVLSALPLLRLFASSFALFGVWLYVSVSVCLVYLSVGCLVVNLLDCCYVGLLSPTLQEKYCMETRILGGSSLLSDDVVSLQQLCGFQACSNWITNKFAKFALQMELWTRIKIYHSLFSQSLFINAWKRRVSEIK